MRVRRATEDDLDDILAMDRACFPYDAPAFSGDGVTWWLADGAGYVGAYRSTIIPETLYMHRVGVLPEARGQHLSERLVRCVTRLAARTEGCAGVVTDTCSPAMANALYRCGWRLFEPPWPWSLPRSVYFRWARP